jgi:ATP-dependent DNA helicase RecG
MKRIGVVERSGRGVDKIYRGLLKFGRPAPGYSRTDSHSVVVRLATDPADMDFARLVVEQERQQNAQLPIDSLIALSALREFKRLSADELAARIQRDSASAKRTLEALTEAGLTEAHGRTRGRNCTLSAAVYQRQGNKSAYTRQAGFAPIQHEQMVLNYIHQHGHICRAEVMDLCHLTRGQAWKLLKRLTDQGKIQMQGVLKGAFYTGADS